MNGKQNKIQKVLLTQPNQFKSGKRAWKVFPYALGILNACIKNNFNTELFDPNFNNLSDEEITEFLKKTNPDVVGVSTSSTEYVKNTEHMTFLIKKALPKAIIVEGGTLPTVLIDLAMKDKNVDYWIIGEGEFNFLELLNELNKENPNVSSIKGIAYYENKQKKINMPDGYIDNLDSVPFADYGNLNFMDYANENIKFSQGLCARKLPFALTTTSRGCPYKCVFCAGSRVSGKQVRMRSAENVLKEIDDVYKRGIKEMIFLDDHFLFNRQRAIDIMKGLIERKYDLSWKCVNLTVFLLDEELIDLMKKSGCYQITISVESGNQYVLDNIIKKPINLEKLPEILNLIKKYELEIIANFVIGFPHETWEQIKDTVAFAEKIDVDFVNFHIATPLPNTELMETCIKEGHVPENFIENLGNLGYTCGVITTDEFSPKKLQILRAFEWDRINFKTKKKKEIIAKIQGLTMEELEQWRENTRQKLGVNVLS